LEGNLGGWVSENHFTLIRICKWVLSCLDDLVEDPPYLPSSKPLCRWYGNELKLWLCMRQVPFPSIRVEATSKNLMEWRGGAPIVIRPVGGPIKNAKNVVISHVTMMVHYMGLDHVSPTILSIVSQLIKILLSAVEVLDELVRDSISSPMWCVKSNLCVSYKPS